jgi:hypothetical protein
MLRIFTNNIDSPIADNNLAVFANFLNRSSDFHKNQQSSNDIKNLFFISEIQLIAFRQISIYKKKDLFVKISFEF